jgi:hypothetical protein
MTDDSIDYRLHKLRERFERLVNGDYSPEENAETTPEELASEFGLSVSQAKAWLRQEPNYPADEKKHFSGQTKRKQNLFKPEAPQRGSQHFLQKPQPRTGKLTSIYNKK